MARPVSLTGLLARAGFNDVTRDAAMFDEPFLDAVRQRLEPDELEQLIVALGRAADPDQALLSLVRLGEAAGDGETRLREVLASDTLPRDRLIAVLGASPALGDWLINHPADVAIVLDQGETLARTPEQMRALLLQAVGADPQAAMPVAGGCAADGALDEMRRAYRRLLVAIATYDLTADDPLSLLPQVAADLAHLAGAALEGALALARAELTDHGQGVRLAVLGMGKTGGEELNYISDVDVIYVAEPTDGMPEDQALRAATKLAATVARMCSTPSREPALWEVDAALRPEGKNGPLVRTLDSHLSYYQRWAKTWEFQALLKARHVAGDAALSQAYLDATRPMVWEAVGRENFVEDAQAMRRRVEDHVPPAEAERQIKLGRGGLRDVEFTVQLLQLVHGRVDQSIRSATTLEALDALAAGGYVGRDHAAELGECYRFLRVLEHRVQLGRLRRTHLMPTREDDLRRLARSARIPVAGPDGLPERWKATRRKVRGLHEELFYRPLLPETARLSAADVTLTAEAATARLRAIGYRDPDGATRHIKALTEGVSRRAAIQRQLLPVMLGWFGEGSDPDGALLAFRKLSDSLGSTHWYLKLLRDSGAAADRLAHLLAGSTYVADSLARLTEAVAWLDDDADLEPRTPAALETQLDSMLTRRVDAGEAASAVRFLRRRELTRGAIRDVLEDVPVDTCRRVIAPTADIALAGALRIAAYEANHKQGITESPTTFLIMAMGRLGGEEIGYASDADVIFVHDPRPGADPQQAKEWAHDVAAAIPSLLGSMTAEPQLQVDTALRPEGKQGPVVRTLESYAQYYQRWVLAWERQALLRARQAGGDLELGEKFRDLIDPYRYPADGLNLSELRELRRIKARVEAERLPRGTPATHHLKLGRGGLADVEWTAQLLQLQHAGAHPELRVLGTRETLLAARNVNLLSAADAHRLIHAWELATRLRNAIVLATGRTSGQRVDVLPADRQNLSAVSRLLGYDVGHAVDLEQDWLKAARQARAVMERVFYG